MKTSLLILGILFSQLSFGQTLTACYDTTKVQWDVLLAKPAKDKKDIKSENNNKYRPDLLTVLFANTFNSVLLGSNDVVTSRYYTTLTNEDNEFAFGYNLNFQKDKIKKATWLFGAGATLKSKSGFATIYKNSQIQSGFGLNFKASRIGRGIIKFSDADKQSSLDLYNLHYYGQYKQKLKKYVHNDLEGEVTRKRLAGENCTKAAVTKMIDDKGRELRTEMAEEEVKAIQEFHLYKRLWDHAWSFSLNVPLSHTEYKTADSLTQVKPVDQKYFPVKLTAQWTNAWQWRKETRLFINARGKIFSNNNIETSGISSADFRSFVNQSSTNQAVTATNKVYVGEFRRFGTIAFAAEVIFFPCDWWVGASASLEQNIGFYNSTDWKFGIPLVLKDKEGKPTVNTELQLKGVNKVLFLGLRFGFVLGKFAG